MSDYQFFWRCEHHLIAMKNFFENLGECEWGCNKQELKWYHNGTLPQKPFVPYVLNGV